jgi:FlaA1/EpsC-like NDP-sugar epimerase
MIKSLLESNRKVRRSLAVLADILFLSFAFWSAMSLRMETIHISMLPETIAVLCTTILSSLTVFTRLGLYRAVIRFMSNHALIAVVTGVTISSVVLWLSALVFEAHIPRAVPFIFWCLALVMIGGSRMLVRSYIQLQYLKSREKVVIYGAGGSGLQLSSMLFQGRGYLPIAFVDDNPLRQGMIINGLRVYPPAHLPKLLSQYGVSRILLALGSAPRSKRNSVIKYLEELPAKVQTIPTMTDILRGSAKISEIRDVELEDLLGRDEIELTSETGMECIKGKVVMVTGAGGSIGSELCRQILEHGPRTLVIFELSEYALYAIHQELSEIVELRKLPVNLRCVVGSVQKQHRMEVVLATFGVNTIYHAAAYKHVPIVEHNVVEGVRNNLFGTWYTAEAAIRSHVETFVLISTDKAVRPTNVMGASKRMAEMVLQALSHKQSVTRFCMVRFGNVLGSSGSVVPLFREQIRAGGPVTVTHKDVTRYFMTIPEAAQLVLQASTMGEGGEVFVLDMGEPVKIEQLARKMIHLMGYGLKDEANPNGEIEIVYKGLRSGEKLFEEMLIGNDPQGTEHPRILKAREKFPLWEVMQKTLMELDAACHNFDCDTVRALLQSADTDYTPMQNLQDLVWNEAQKLRSNSPKVQAISTKSTN